MRSLLVLFLALTAFAHVGVNDVFFEGLAGPYPLYVTVRPPVVIPGVADITIRSAAKDVTAIEIAPMTLTGPGSQYPPTPDQATASKDDPQTFTGGLWIMSPGSWQVRAVVTGARGKGTVSVPVRAASQKVSTMDTTTGAVLLGLMGLLVLGAVGIAGAALRESQLPPGTLPDSRLRTRGYIAMAVGLVLSGGIIWAGANWWSNEANAYARSLYKALTLTPTLNGNQLALAIAPSGTPRPTDDFIPDHGHLMHLYAIRESDLGLAWHLHPRREAPGRFLTDLPALPAGRYRLFADVVHQSGFPETLTATIDLPTATPGPSSNPDDAGAELKPNPLVTLEVSGTLKPGQPVTLRFRVQDPDGNPAANLRPYLGMPAHLAVIKKDFSVFSHLHPNGNISMAAFEMAQSNNLRYNDSMVVSSHASDRGGPVSPDFGFPFGFPTSGDYQLVLQFARQDRVETTAFRLVVPD